MADIVIFTSDYVVITLTKYDTPQGGNLGELKFEVNQANLNTALDAQFTEIIKNNVTQYIGPSYPMPPFPPPTTTHFSVYQRVCDGCHINPATTDEGGDVWYCDACDTLVDNPPMATCPVCSQTINWKVESLSKLKGTCSCPKTWEVGA